MSETSQGDIIEFYSAGINPERMDPLAVNVMREMGVDISGQHSNSLTDLDGIEFDCMITFCDNAREVCPMFLGDTRIFRGGFDDRPCPARSAKTEDGKLVQYSRLRDEIRTFVEKLSELLLK